jgi:hypothetical protein
VADLLPLPAVGTQIFDAQTGYLTIQGQNYFEQLNAFISAIAGAPADAQYWVSVANGSLTNEENLGALSSGYLKITVAVGHATPNVTATIPTSDLSGLISASIITGVLAPANGGTGSNLAGTGGASQVLRQSSAGANVTVSQLASTDLSDQTAWTNWTPTDQSGASLSLTVTTAKYWQLGKTVIFHTQLAYPATGSGANAALSLPVTPLSGVGQPLTVGFNQNAVAITSMIQGGLLVFHSNGGGVRQTNASFTGATLILGGAYQAN